MVQVPEQFTGYGASSAEAWRNLQLMQFQPKPFEDYDVDIEIDWCGVCGSDLHTLSNGWGGTMYPIVVGHEIVGKVVGVGSKVSLVKVGDVVGVGANSWSCGQCRACKRDLEQYCPDLVETYNFKYKDGSRSWGGYANFARVNERFVFPIPKELPPAVVAPMLCAGLTVYSPLSAAGVRWGTRVGVIGIGGLGHFAVMLAAAMGAEVTAISHSPRKKEDALKMGAKHFVATSAEDWATPNSRSLDLIVCTSFAKDMPLDVYLSMLDIGGTLVYVGIPESDLPSLPPTLMIGNNSALRGSNTGSRKEVLEMLDLAVKTDVRSWIETLPMSRCQDAIEKQEAGQSRYRIVLDAHS